MLCVTAAQKNQSPLHSEPRDDLQPPLQNGLHQLAAARVCGQGGKPALPSSHSQAGICELPEDRDSGCPDQLCIAVNLGAKARVTSA